VTSISNNITSNPNQIIVESYLGSKHTFNYACSICKPSGVLDAVLAWCRSEMQDATWRWQMRSQSSPFENGEYIFYFNNERDYLAFILRWK
jgi:hypothetical protein